MLYFLNQYKKLRLRLFNAVYKDAHDSQSVAEKQVFWCTIGLTGKIEHGIILEVLPLTLKGNASNLFIWTYRACLDTASLITAKWLEMQQNNLSSINHNTKLHPSSLVSCKGFKSFKLVYRPGTNRLSLAFMESHLISVHSKWCGCTWTAHSDNSTVWYSKIQSFFTLRWLHDDRMSSIH